MTIADRLPANRVQTDPFLALALVGTDFHPFDRLVGWVDACVAAADGSVRWIVQHGASSPPSVAEGRPFLARDELERLLARSSLVVCHGGPGTITEARRHGHVPIVVPRDAAKGEHVDDHQKRFAMRLAEAGHIHLAEDRHGFEASVRNALADPRHAATGAQIEPRVERFRELADRLLAEPPRGWSIGALAGRAGRKERKERRAA